MMAPTLSLSRQTCCVAGCTNSYANMASSGETIQFYRFPMRPFYLERRNVWISAVRKTRGDDWEPKHNSRICSHHFHGNRKSDNPRNLNYNPSIFPQPQKQRAPCHKPELVSQPQLQRKRTCAPEFRGRRRPLKKRRACAFELQHTSTNDCGDYDQPTASPGSPTIEFDGKNQVERCEVGTMTSLEVREVGTMMPFKDCDERRRVKRRHIGTVTFLQPGELPCRPYAFFCVSDGRNASTQTWCKYISVQSTQTHTPFATAPPPPPRGRSLVAVSNAAVGPDHKSVCFARAQATASHGCSLVGVSNAMVGPDHKSVGFPGAQSAAASCDRPPVTVSNVAVGPDHKTVCFVGAQSMHQDDESMQSLCAVTATMFALLVSIIPNARTFHDISKADRLTLFLMKLKTGLTYGSLAALFGIHRTTVARCFHNVLNALFEKTCSWIEWKHSTDVLSKAPDYFKLHYPNCKIIIDCTEARVAQPAPVEIRDFYTCSKETFSAKFLFGVAPNGALTFVRSAGDKGSLLDEFTAAASPLDPTDVLPHKPSAKSASLSQSSEVLVTPPSSNGECSNPDKVAAVHSVYSVRMHVDRMIHRLKFFNILNLPLSSDLQDNMDRIVHVICILANLQGSILKSSNHVV
ncbi:uncharacterized protein LOC119442123 [Dermacentor silvarum]|uniref:uncharacterized protein LOC119442123 n=1 Tax=Dermacentor silvarum TaxID=543639 RepID=UPI0018971371|nr:uncharacterized protein LOC119442123 [Dermacentor silvarum]